MYDVAKKAGVSPKTVSRVLNGDAPVGAKTREAVEQAIAELGYVPSSAARMMRSNKSGLIGLITGAISRSPTAMEPVGLPDLHIVQGIQSVINATNKTLMIADTMGDESRVPQLLQTFMEHRVEGLFFVTDHHQQIELPVTVNRPLVMVNCHDGGATPAVIPDDYSGQYSLVSRLVANGHTRIAYLTLGADKIATQLRLDGYRQSLCDSGIAFDAELVSHEYIVDPEAMQQLLWDTIDRLLKLDEPPTVICTGNDEMAARVYKTLQSMDVSVPGKLSVAGYDNYRAIAETLNPPLTTVELPYWAMGIKAANLLVNLIDGVKPESNDPIEVGGSVHWRASVAARAGSVTRLKTTRRKSE